MNYSNYDLTSIHNKITKKDIKFEWKDKKI